MANTARITQDAVEFAASQNGSVRITQDTIEFITGAGIACGSPPGGIVGLAYMHAFPNGGGTPPYTFSISAGALPTGLNLNTSTGVISGTPTTKGTFTFTITIIDIMGTTQSVVCSITITQQPISILLYGWKLYPDAPCDAAVELPEVPPVKRAV